MSAVMQASTEMELSEPSSARLRADMAPLAAVQLLIEEGETSEALKLLARLLPKRYAVAWLCQCARDQPLSMEDKAGASLAEAWVRDPDEPRRRAALDFASAGEYRTLGAWIAASAGWSGGSLAPAAQEVAVPPADHLTARAVVASINLMAALDIEQFTERRNGFIERAMVLLGNGVGSRHD
ncbi:MAG TPA: hypothetical protein VLZ32_01360 [Rhodanobacter sp.]|nr:hypothetical protein [Rhodanobacter sp.]